MPAAQQGSEAAVTRSRPGIPLPALPGRAARQALPSASAPELRSPPAPAALGRTARRRARAELRLGARVGRAAGDRHYMWDSRGACASPPARPVLLNMHK